ncbi:MAG: HNH endonuclease [Lacipirellulaceae bacterium]
MKLTNIASLDPAIMASGRSGLSGASAADKAMWQEMNVDWYQFAMAVHAAQEALSVVHDLALEEEGFIDSVEDVSYLGSTKESLVNVRVGQAFFRNSVLSAYDNRCCVSGLALPELLVASHIVPWSKDDHNRLNPKNGLAMSVLHDKAFDRGFITIADDLTVRVSASARKNADSFFSSAIAVYDGTPIALPEKFRPEPSFLQYHRTHVFND